MSEKRKKKTTPPIKPLRRRKNARTIEPSAPLTKRGEEAKKRIRLAAARLLEKNSYRDLRLSDIVEASGYTIGVFYYYYKDKKSVALEIIENAFAEGRRILETEVHIETAADLFDVIYKSTLEEALVYKKHPGLFRSAAQFADEEPELAEAFDRRNQYWTQFVADDFYKRFSKSDISQERCFALAFFLNNAVNSFLNEYYVHNNQKLASGLKSPEEVARFLTICWYRLLLLMNPDVVELSGFEEFSRISNDYRQEL